MTLKQILILDFLEDNGHTALHTATPPSHIAAGIGIDKGPRRNRGPWSGYQNPAQFIIASLTSLRRQGMIGRAPRPDGLSGTAYYITKKGLES